MLPDFIIEEAVKVANLSPCKKSKRGVVIFDRNFQIVGRGFNSLPPTYFCAGDQTCRNNCSKSCVHAEQAAIMDALGHGPVQPDWQLLHVKTVDGEEVSSGPPSCWQCSKLILHTGIPTVWLLHDDGWYDYSAEGFHRITLKVCGIEHEQPVA